MEYTRQGCSQPCPKYQIWASTERERPISDSQRGDGTDQKLLDAQRI